MLELNREHLKESTSLVMQVYAGLNPSREVNPRMIRLEAERGSLRLTTRHAGMATAVVLGKAAQDFWALMVPGVMFENIVKKGGQTLQIEHVPEGMTTPPGLRFVSGKTEVFLEGTDCDEHAEKAGNYAVQHADFPELSGVVPGLSAALTKAAKIAPKADYQGVFRHVALQPQGDEFDVVGTDGFRVVATRIAFDLGALLPLGEQIIANAPQLRRALRIAGDLRIAADHEHVYLGNSTVCFRIDTEDGTYPDWRRHMPNHPHVILADREDLAAAVRRALIMTERDSTAALWLMTTPGWNVLRVRAEGPYGSSEEQVELQTTPTFETEMDFRFNGKFLQQMIDQHEGPLVSIHAGSVVQPCRADDGPTQFLLVPLRDQVAVNA